MTKANKKTTISVLDMYMYIFRKKQKKHEGEGEVISFNCIAITITTTTTYEIEIEIIDFHKYIIWEDAFAYIWLLSSSLSKKDMLQQVY